MSNALPMYIDCADASSVLPGAEPVSATLISDTAGKGCGGALLVGVHGTLDSIVGLVTVSIYDRQDVATARQYFSVSLDFTTETQTSELVSGIPMMKDPWFTVTGDLAATGKSFTLLPYLKKISIGS